MYIYTYTYIYIYVAARHVKRSYFWYLFLFFPGGEPTINPNFVRQDPVQVFEARMQRICGFIMTVINRGAKF